MISRLECIVAVNLFWKYDLNVTHFSPRGVVSSMLFNWHATFGSSVLGGNIVYFERLRFLLKAIYTDHNNNQIIICINVLLQRYAESAALFGNRITTLRFCNDPLCFHVFVLFVF